MNKFIFICLFDTFLSLFPTVDDQIIFYINQYTRPITFLVIDNKNDSMSLFSYSKKFPESVFVLISNNDCVYPETPPHNFIHLKTNGTIDELRHLGECEHFDMVLIKDHNNELNEQCASVLYALGENVFINVEKRQELFEKHIRELGFNKISHSIVETNLFHCYHPVTFLKRTHWFESASSLNSVRHIISTLHEKKLHKKYDPKHVPTTWLPGINLMTFKVLNGCIPQETIMRNEIVRLFNISHLDWMPNNMILQGCRVELIDFDPLDSEPKTVNTPHMLELMLEFVQAEKKDIEHIYQKILVYCRNYLHPELITHHRALSLWF